MAILRPLHDTILKTTHALYILKLCYNTKLLFMSSLEIHPLYKLITLFVVKFEKKAINRSIYMLAPIRKM